MLRENYLSRVGKILNQSQPSSSMRPFTAARIGTILNNSSLPNLRDQGFEKVADVLSALETMGVLELYSTDKGALAVRMLSNVDQTQSVEKPKSRHLRHEVWMAFVSPVPAGNRVFVKSTNEVKVGLAPDQHLSDDELAIQPIPIEEQLSWANKFGRDVGVSDAELDSVRTPSEFWELLKSKSSDLARNWNKERTLKVNLVVDEWCSKNQITFAKLNSRQKFEGSEKDSEQRAPIQIAHHRGERGVMLKAISLMSDDELRALSIPIKYVLAASQNEEDQPT